jgi:putative transposase
MMKSVCLNTSGDIHAVSAIYGEAFLHISSIRPMAEPSIQTAPGTGTGGEHIAVVTTSVNAQQTRTLHDTWTPNSRSWGNRYFKHPLNREGLGIEVDLSLPSARVIRSLEQIIEWRGRPVVIRCDNGPEYLSEAIRDWARGRDIHLEHIQPGTP